MVHGCETSGKYTFLYFCLVGDEFSFKRDEKYRDNYTMSMSSESIFISKGGQVEWFDEGMSGQTFVLG